MKYLFKTLALYLFIAFLIPFFSGCTKSADTPDGIEEIIPGGEDESEEEQPTKPEVDTKANCVLTFVSEKTRYPNGTSISLDLYSNIVYEINKWSGRTVFSSYVHLKDTNFLFSYNMPYTATIHTPWGDAEAKLGQIYHLVEEEIHAVRTTYKYTYDSKLRLTKCHSYYGSNPEGVKEFYYDDKYNMIGYKRIDADGKVIEEAKIEYTDILSKSIPLQCLASTLTPFAFFSINWSFLEMGFFGNSIPMYLVKKIVTKTNNSESEYEYEFEYDYTLDKNGYVETMTQIRYDASETFFSTYTFEWTPVSTPSYTNWLFSDIGSPYYRYLHE